MSFDFEKIISSNIDLLLTDYPVLKNILRKALSTIEDKKYFKSFTLKPKYFKQLLTFLSERDDYGMLDNEYISFKKYVMEDVLFHLYKLDLNEKKYNVYLLLTTAGNKVYMLIDYSKNTSKPTWLKNAFEKNIELKKLNFNDEKIKNLKSICTQLKKLDIIFSLNDDLCPKTQFRNFIKRNLDYKYLMQTLSKKSAPKEPQPAPILNNINDVLSVLLSCSNQANSMIRLLGIMLSAPKSINYKHSDMPLIINVYGKNDATEFMP